MYTSYIKTAFTVYTFTRHKITVMDTRLLHSSYLKDQILLLCLSNPSDGMPKTDRAANAHDKYKSSKANYACAETRSQGPVIHVLFSQIVVLPVNVACRVSTGPRAMPELCTAFQIIKSIPKKVPRNLFPEAGPSPSLFVLPVEYR